MNHPWPLQTIPVAKNQPIKIMVHSHCIDVGGLTWWEVCPYGPRERYCHPGAVSSVTKPSLRRPLRLGSGVNRERHFTFPDYSTEFSEFAGTPPPSYGDVRVMRPQIVPPPSTRFSQEVQESGVDLRTALARLRDVEHAHGYGSVVAPTSTSRFSGERANE